MTKPRSLLEQTLWPRSTRSRAAILALSAYMLLYLTWQVWHWTPGRQQYGQAFLPLMDAAALYATLVAVGRCAGSARLRSFWQLMSIAVAAQLIADVLLLANVIKHKVPPFPSPADPFFLTFYVLLFLALLRVPVAPVSRARRIRILLDGATIVIGGGAVVWYFVLGPTAIAGEESTLASIVSIAYPVGDLILLAGLAAVLLRRVPDVLRVPLLLIAAGMLCSIVADVVYGYGELHDTYTNGDPIDTLYMLEFALFALAGASQQPVRPEDISLHVSQWRQPSTRASWLPYLAAPIGFGLLLGVDWTHPFFPELSLVVIALLIGTLIAARQYLALRELARAERALRESELRFRAIFDNAGVGIAFSDIEGPAIIDFNQTFSRMVGYTPAELRGQDFNAITHPDDIALFQALTPDTLQGFQRELRVLHRDGHELWGSLTLSLLHDTEGTPRFIIGALQDITQRKEAEKTKDEFLSVVGHELRTPLTSIRGSLGLLEGGVLGELPEEATSILSIAVINTDRLVRLINDILDVERLSSGRVEIALNPVKATDLVHQATQTVQVTATLSQVKLQSEATDLLVCADHDRIIQVLVNLIGNAIKFSPPESTITTTVTADDGWATFSIQDQGRGIPADRIEAIFERFRQIDASDAREKGGTGLGLPIARSIVEHHGGRMWAESTPGAGSTFHFTLPLHGEQVTALVCGHRHHPESNGAAYLAELQSITPTLASSAVLIVEDDPTLGQILEETLNHQGVPTQLVRTAQAAVERIRHTRPKILLLDLMLPGDDGFTVIERLRGEGLLADTPLLVYTALDLNEQDRERLQLAHTEFYSKATSTPQDIQTRVSELLTPTGDHTT
jgi:PAS domain S-box-containing protein